MSVELREKNKTKTATSSGGTWRTLEARGREDFNQASFPALKSTPPKHKSRGRNHWKPGLKRPLTFSRPVSFLHDTHFPFSNHINTSKFGVFCVLGIRFTSFNAVPRGAAQDATAAAHPPRRVHRLRLRGRVCGGLHLRPLQQRRHRPPHARHGAPALATLSGGVFTISNFLYKNLFVLFK